MKLQATWEKIEIIELISLYIIKLNMKEEKNKIQAQEKKRILVI